MAAFYFKFLTILLVIVAVLIPQSMSMSLPASNFSSLAAPPNQNCSKFISCLQYNGIQRHQLVLQNEPAYPELNYQWNIRKGIYNPWAYFVPENTGEIQIVTKCGQLNRIRVIPKSGGHGYEKYQFSKPGNNTNVIVDLRKFDGVHVDLVSQTATVGVANLAGPLIWKLYNQSSGIVGNLSTGLGLPVGLCPSVGIGGLTLGGGHGYFTRHFGMTSDNLIQAEIVTAGGTMLKVNEYENSDLFWALRGAGHMSFGVVTYMKFKLFKIPAVIKRATFTYDVQSFPDVFLIWQHVIRNGLAKVYNTHLYVFNAKISLIIIQTGPNTSSNDNETEFNRIVDQFPKNYESIKIEEKLSYKEFYLTSSGGGKPTFDDIQYINRTQTKQVYRKTISFYVSKLLDQQCITTMYNYILASPPESPAAFTAEGGAVDELESWETAYVHRKPNTFMFQAFIILDVNYTIEQEEYGLKWLKDIYSGSEECTGHVESYQNYQDEYLGGNYLKRYYGNNLEKLMEIKQEFDPENYFNFPQGVPPPAAKGNQDA